MKRKQVTPTIRVHFPIPVRRRLHRQALLAPIRKIQHLQRSRRLHLQAVNQRKILWLFQAVNQRKIRRLFQAVNLVQ
ncbi:MAG: hypothetical protein JW384_00960 [Nitrosomonadaceae bacterium]|nr:hypothetical protein [Nitrosomonadaceae bacterium]